MKKDLILTIGSMLTREQKIQLIKLGTCLLNERQVERITDLFENLVYFRDDVFTLHINHNKRRAKLELHKNVI